MIVSAYAQRLIKHMCQELEEQIIRDLKRDGDDRLADIGDVRDAARVIFESDARSIWDIKD